MTGLPGAIHSFTAKTAAAVAAVTTTDGQGIVSGAAARRYGARADPDDKDLLEILSMALNAGILD